MKSCSSCKSKDVFITDYHTVVCTRCGVEKRCAFEITPLHVSYNCNHHQPFASGYNRQKRFNIMLSNVLFGGCNRADEHMIKYLIQFKPYTDESSLLKQMKHSCLRDKRYTSLHLFARLFLESYQKVEMPTNWDAVEKSIMRMFGEIELAHHRVFSKPFFSYVWLLQKILLCHKIDWCSRFIKQLKCPKRVNAYEDDFCKIKAMLCLQGRFVATPACASTSPKLLVEHTGGRCLHHDQRSRQ